MKKSYSRILFGLLVLAVISVAGFVIWAETPLGPAPEALFALEGDTEVQVNVDDLITFGPADLQPDTGLIFYPGGHVDVRSYAAPLHSIASHGFLVILLPMRLNLAMFDVNAGQKAIDRHPEISHWVVGGHSLGGVASALFAKKHPELEGIIFWASYPPDDTLKGSNLSMLSIYGTNDMGGVEQFESRRDLLTADATVVVVDGGNHSQFGDYGLQPGDHPADISASEQQAQVVLATVEFLKSLQK